MKKPISMCKFLLIYLPSQLQLTNCISRKEDTSASTKCKCRVASSSAPSHHTCTCCVSLPSTLLLACMCVCFLSEYNRKLQPLYMQYARNLEKHVTAEIGILTVSLVVYLSCASTRVSVMCLLQQEWSRSRLSVRLQGWFHCRTIVPLLYVIYER